MGFPNGGLPLRIPGASGIARNARPWQPDMAAAIRIASATEEWAALDRLLTSVQCARRGEKFHG